MSQTALLVAGIQARGFVEVKSASGKYRTFRNSEGVFLHVGKSGALRKSKKGSVSDSISLTDTPAKRAFIYVGECMKSWKQPVSRESIDEAFMAGMLKRNE